MSTRGKLDLYKEHTAEYVAPKAPALVAIKPATYLSIVGKGDPGGEVFGASVGALYGVAFTIKMASKAAGKDYRVCGLEGLWWGSPKDAAQASVSPAKMHWKLLIRTPAFITRRDLARAAATLKEKGRGRLVDRVRIEKITEGLCVQALHVGPYAEEAGTIARMEAFAREQGLRFHGEHHELYVSDPRRVPPARLRTILRHPVRRQR